MVGRKPYPAPNGAVGVEPRSKRKQTEVTFPGARLRFLLRRRYAEGQIHGAEGQAGAQQ